MKNIWLFTLLMTFGNLESNSSLTSSVVSDWISNSSEWFLQFRYLPVFRNSCLIISQAIILSRLFILDVDINYLKKWLYYYPDEMLTWPWAELHLTLCRPMRQSTEQRRLREEKRGTLNMIHDTASGDVHIHFIVSITRLKGEKSSKNNLFDFKDRVHRE